MAKRKSKKGSLDIILAIVVIGLAIVTVCTLFMPIFTSKSTSAVLGSTSTSHIKGIDAITAAFNSKTSGDLSNGANALIALKNSEESGAVTGIFCWTYLLTVVVSVVILALAVLRICGLKLKLVDLIVGLATVVFALVTFILGFVVASKFGSVNLGTLMTGNTVASVANYFMLLAIACGCTNLYLASK
jgi:hypothetical protein